MFPTKPRLFESLLKLEGQKGAKTQQTHTYLKPTHKEENKIKIKKNII